MTTNQAKAVVAAELRAAGVDVTAISGTKRTIAVTLETSQDVRRVVGMYPGSLGHGYLVFIPR